MQLGNLAAWIAAFVSMTMTSIILYTRWKDRQLPCWNVERIMISGDRRLRELSEGGFGRMPDRCLMALNVGDGDAFGVSVTGKNCTVAILRSDSSDVRGFYIARMVPLIESGGELAMLAWFDPKHAQDAEIELTCTRGPTQHGKRLTHRFALASTEFYAPAINHEMKSDSDVSTKQS